MLQRLISLCLVFMTVLWWSPTAPATVGRAAGTDPSFRFTKLDITDSQGHVTHEFRQGDRGTIQVYWRVPNAIGPVTARIRITFEVPAPAGWRITNRVLATVTRSGQREHFSRSVFFPFLHPMLRVLVAITITGVTRTRAILLSVRPAATPTPTPTSTPTPSPTPVPKRRGKFGFTFTLFRTLATNGHAQSTFKVRQPFVMDLSWTVVNLQGRTLVTRTFTYQLQHGKSWKTIGTITDQSITVNGVNLYRKQSSFDLPGTFRLIARLGIKGEAKTRMVTVRIG